MLSYWCFNHCSRYSTPYWDIYKVCFKVTYWIVWNAQVCWITQCKHKIAGLHLRYHHWSWEQASVWAESRDLYVATLAPGWEPGLIEYITRLYLTKCPSQIRSIFHVTAIPGRPREEEREEKMAVWKGWFEIGLVSIKVWSMVHIFIIHTKVRVS